MRLNCYKDSHGEARCYTEDPYEGRMIFNSLNYNSELEMWSDIGCFMRTLAKNNQTAIMYPEESLVIIEFAYNERTNPMGGPRAIWVDEEEYEAVESMRIDFQEEIHSV